MVKGGRNKSTAYRLIASALLDKDDISGAIRACQKAVSHSGEIRKWERHRYERLEQIYRFARRVHLIDGNFVKSDKYNRRLTVLYKEKNKCN